MLGLKVLAFAAVSIGMYLVLLTPIRWALWFLFLYIGLEGFLKVVSNYHPIIHVSSDLLVITLTLKVVLLVFFEGIPPGKLPPLSKLFMIHFLWLAIVFFNPYSLSFFSSVAGAKIYISMFLLYFYGYYNVNSLKDVRFFMMPFIIIAVLHTITGLIQGIVGPEAVLKLHPRYAVQLMKYQGFAFRPFGLTNLPGGPAVYIYQVYPFILYFLFHYRSVFARLFLISFIPLSTFLFFLCQVRSALLKMIVASSLYVIGVMHVFSTSSYRSLQRIVLLTSTLGLILYFTLPRFMEYSVAMRADNEAAIERSLSLFEYDRVSTARRGTWDRFVQYAKEVPFGAGFSRVGAAAGAFKELHKEDKIFGYKHFFTDNLWLSVLVEVGLPGMLIISMLVFLVFFRGIRDYLNSRSEEMKLVYLAIISPLIALVMGLYGAEGLIYNPEACFFWFFSGVLLKLRVIENNRESQVAVKS